MSDTAKFSKEGARPKVPHPACTITLPRPAQHDRMPTMHDFYELARRPELWTGCEITINQLVRQVAEDRELMRFDRKTRGHATIVSWCSLERHPLSTYDPETTPSTGRRTIDALLASHLCDMHILTGVLARSDLYRYRRRHRQEP